MSDRQAQAGKFHLLAVMALPFRRMQAGSGSEKLRISSELEGIVEAGVSQHEDSARGPRDRGDRIAEQEIDRGRDILVDVLDERRNDLIGAEQEPDHQAADDERRAVGQDHQEQEHHRGDDRDDQLGEMRVVSEALSGGSRLPC